ncbi:hypothetical protein C8R44DRAFT_662580 [Mycena epipterygia]|nr:hypothetical protein C8R44DRAFT_662580 [Mycena epipterygia]
MNLRPPSAPKSGCLTATSSFRWNPFNFVSTAILYFFIQFDRHASRTPWSVSNIGTVSRVTHPLVEPKVCHADRPQREKAKFFVRWSNFFASVTLNLALVEWSNCILSNHSSVFGDMFSLPQPPNEATVEGYPIVHLTGDSVQDVEIILAAFYDPYHNKPSQPFHVVAAMLRLGRKYDIPKFKDDAVSRVRHYWGCSSLAEFLAPLNLSRIDLYNGLELDLLNLAYENGLHSCIPALAYSCLNGFSLKDLFTGINSEAAGSPHVATVADGVRVKLILGLESLLLAQENHNLAWALGGIAIPQPACSSPDLCSRAHLKTCQDFLRHFPNRVALYALIPWEHLWTERPHNYCAVCESAAKAKHQDGLETFWDLLPTFFGLPEWTDLQNMD